MQKLSAQKVKIEPSRSSKNQLGPILPILQKHKGNLGQEQQRYMYRLLKGFESEESEKINPEEKEFQAKNKHNQDSLNISKDSFNYYKKMRGGTPIKPAYRQKNTEKGQVDAMRRQFDHIKSSNISKQKMVLSSIVQCIEKEVGTRWKIVNQNKFSNRAIMYQPYKKKPGNHRERSKISVSQANIQNNQSCFFSVQKMTLLEGQKTKKSNTIAVSPGCQEKIYPKRRESVKSPRDYSLIKEINNIKERLNLQRILDMNDELYTQDQRMLKDAITVTPWNQRQSRLERTRPTSSAKEEHPIIDSADTPTFQTMHSNTEGLSKAQKDSLLDIQKDNFKVSSKKSSILPSRKMRRKFIVPFETYYYRDLIWKMNFTNNRYVEVPLEYEHRLKVFVGKGNNSCMVRGLISRRPWFAFTDKIQEANFVWTQIKNLTYFKKQEPLPRQFPIQSHSQASYVPDSILTQSDNKTLWQYFHVHLYSEQHNDQRLLSRAKIFKYSRTTKVSMLRQQRMQNHLINNYILGNKKALFSTMSAYYKDKKQEVFDFLPLTFHIKDGMEDKKYFQFLRYYHKRNKEIGVHNQGKLQKLKEYNSWIVKPGENSNRGNGIKMCLTLEEIKNVLKQRERYYDGTYRTHIVQAYIERPLLYHKRKFDLRHYVMITCINGILKGYWYKEGYVRTTACEYSLSNSSGAIHLTNDAVQKNLPEYGKYEKGNKLSYDELNNYIEKYHKKKGKGFYDTIYKKMKHVATDAIRACSGGIDPSKLANNFQIFGLDFMIDSDLDVWLIEINTNPCLELSCPLLSSLIPRMVQNALQLTLDCMFPPPVRYSPKGVHYLKQLQKENKFQLVYDERMEPLYTGSLGVLDSKLLEEEDDTFEDSGDEWEDN